MKHGKHYVDSAKLFDRTKLYDTEEAMDLCCKTAKAKFDETVELHVRLGVDSRHADQQVRGAIVLPHGTGKNVRVIAICKGDAAKAAEAQADINNDIDTKNTSGNNGDGGSDDDKKTKKITVKKGSVATGGQGGRPRTVGTDRWGNRANENNWRSWDNNH